MRYGVVFPHQDAGTSQDGPRRFAAAVENAGFDYLSAPEHILGADSSSRPGWDAPYNVDSAIREPMVLFGFLAAITNLELVSSIVVLPQRETSLFAKQVAELDLLAGGKTRIGVAVGWNELEFESLGIDFYSRAERFEEQIELLRLLWTQRVVSFEGRFHSIDRMGICPLPVQRPIPLWFGGGSGGAGAKIVGHGTAKSDVRVLGRIGRLGDGWMAGGGHPFEYFASSANYVREAAERAGRDPAAIGFQHVIKVKQKSDLKLLSSDIDAHRSVGTTHLTLETRNAGISFDDQLDLIAEIGEVLQKEG